MGIADFQNPLANMPIMQQMQQTQHQQVQSVPMLLVKEAEDQTREQLTTVQTAEEQEEKDRINEEDLDRESNTRNPNRRRAAKLENPKTSAEEKPRVQDGIHGMHLDIQA